MRNMVDVRLRRRRRIDGAAWSITVEALVCHELRFLVCAGWADCRNGN